MWRDLSREKLLDLEKRKQLRRLNPLPQGYADFASNDYLGLKSHSSMIEAAIYWTKKWGVGSGASRLAGGTQEEYLAVEAKLAAFKKREAACIFNSGFQLNATVIPAIIHLYSPSIFTDRLIHASLHHGIAASGIRQTRFRHNDMNHLEDLLGKDISKHKLIITESVFSMDGDLAPLADLAKLAERYNALLYIDEAHATGILGEKGRGLASQLSSEYTLIMGTLGKALGGFGAYICGAKEIIDVLINRAAGFIYSTALPPACYGTLDKALDLIPDMDKERAIVKNRAEKLRQFLKQKRIDFGASQSQIIPAIVGEEERALRAQAIMVSHKLYVPAIRPPTVPPRTSRLRISLHVTQSDLEFQQLLEALAEI